MLWRGEKKACIILAEGRKENIGCGARMSLLVIGEEAEKAAAAEGIYDMALHVDERHEKKK